MLLSSKIQVPICPMNANPMQPYSKSLNAIYIYIYVFIFIYMNVCMCVCVCVCMYMYIKHSKGTNETF